jgi:hypothetical protein
MAVSPVAPGGFHIARANYLHSTSGRPLDVLLDGRIAKVVPTAGPADTPGSLDLSAPPVTQKVYRPNPCDLLGLDETHHQVTEATVQETFTHQGVYA